VARVNLRYDVENENLELHGLSKSELAHPLLAAFLRQENARQDTDLIFLSTTSDELANKYQILNRLLTKLGIETETSNHVSDVLRRVQMEEADFDGFAKEADSIWHSEIETAHFRQFVSIVKAACPGRVFYKKQMLSAYHLAYAQNACNFSVPGAGKTSIVYAAYAYLKKLPVTDRKSVQRLLIVGPKASFKAWDDEYFEIFCQSANSFRIFGEVPIAYRSEYLKGISLNSQNTELTLTSYATLASSEEEFRSFLLNSSKKTMLVLDEAHYIKREDGVQSAAALRLAPLANSRIVLTGTPAPNGYEDLANLFKFIYPTKNIIGFPPATLRAITNGSMPQAISEIKARILPMASETRVPVELGESHDRIYRVLERKIVSSFRAESDDLTNSVRLRARLIRLRQACINPELLLRPLEDQEIFDTGGTYDFNLAESEIADLVTRFQSNRDLQRLSVCEQLVQDILKNQGKVLIWSYFLGNVELLRKRFSNLADFVEVLTGATSVSSQEMEDYDLGSREEIIDRFHLCSGTAVLIANPQAVGESISLHKACRSAIYFDRDFNAGRFIQSKDRIHRYNPDGGRPVNYFHLNTSGTVDDDINFRLIKKEQRLLDLLESEEIPLFSTLEDVENGDDLKAILDSYERRKTQ